MGFRLRLNWFSCLFAAPLLLIVAVSRGDDRRSADRVEQSASLESVDSADADGLPAETPAVGEDAPYQRRGPARQFEGVFKFRIEPHWFADGGAFWYRNRLPGGASEFIVVDAAKGLRKPAFDHERLAAALRTAGVADARGDRLDLADLAFDLPQNAFEFRAAGSNWRCDLQSYEVAKTERRESDGGDRLAALGRDAPRASTRTGEETTVTFVNRTNAEIELFWRDSDGRRQSYGKVEAGGRHEQHTFAGHVWEVVGPDGRPLALFQAEERAAIAEVTEGTGRGPRGPGSFSFRRSFSDTSPDGKWKASIKDHNVFVRPAEAEEGSESQLSDDGSSTNSYGVLSWSPDSTVLAAFRSTAPKVQDVYLIESSPRSGGRAKLHQRPYALPGDEFPAFELNLFSVGQWKQAKPDVERIDLGMPKLRWKPDGHLLTIEKFDRGHQRFRLIEVDAQTAGIRNLIDEKTDTFIWSAHTESVNVPHVTWLENGDEIIFASERDGWRHLYLVDAREGAIKNQITRGQWVVRGIERIDEERRQVWFRASGANAGEDPYFVHDYRIDFDGSNLVALTAGNGNHSIQFSPDRAYLIDTYSRVDMPPVHVLRRASDGGQVCELEQCEIGELKERGWAPPEVFVAKGRDGTTDIWGVIWRPKDFDPEKKYPVLESIYAGPQGSFVPKSFIPDRRFAQLNDLGFIVVQIDGMGTANRSKAFHDVCWKNLKDAGLPDRILWHQAAAARYPHYDISRVGIFGGSAGGQNSTGAVLFHPEFFKVAVSGCGCHDNRMDKASWNEQWMGYPVGPQYAECSNIVNAHRLRGKLMLIVGEMDTNVPTESTFRLADALIKAGKEFELVVVPGEGHGMGGAYGQRKMQDFFVRHLQGVEPPDHNAEPR
jgi:hypothetical protein